MNRHRFSGAVFSLVVLAGTTLRAEDRIPIEVQVEVTEVDHRRALNFGVDWMDKTAFSDGSLDGTIGVFRRVSDVRAEVHFLEENGAAELLANPNLITDAGTVATFNAGGQIPYITSSSLGTTHVEFKPYGVALKIEPSLVPSGMIQLKILASVSAPDQTNGVNLSGNTAPAILEREVTSNITVKPGTTITLAGLVQTHKDETIQGVPLLKDIPLIGMLFRWKKTNFRRTTIVMFMTPKLIS